MSKTRIEIVAIGKEKIFSVGAVEVSEKGDVYVIHKIKDSNFHTSRHSSGELHWKSIKNKVSTKIRDGMPIEDFKGIEFLGTSGFGLESLPKLHKEYKMKKCNGIFAVDMRNYDKAAFNMSVAILTREGLPILFESWNKFKKRQIYLFTECHPMIAITVADVRVDQGKE